ncbi:hypothetical protein [Verrucomicrobium sp. BvORR034]|uniref:hypothetical protein n=1 Tax=Verrucomicrobium sp. BvORR034 TaxID=1396418 RepID=UPI000679010D|nr:hypothetical protein [Verrucomicrobium sp. BvORR034]
MKTNRVDEGTGEVGLSAGRKKRGKAEVPVAKETGMEAETGTGIPPCPVEDPRYGDKTVAVVAWFKEYRPEEFARRYAGRRFFGQD